MLPTAWPKQQSTKTYKKHTVSEMRPPYERAAVAAPKELPQLMCNARVQKLLPRQMLERSTSIRTKLRNKYSPMRPLFRRCWIFPWRFQMFRSYFWTSSFSSTDNLIETISVSKKPSRTRIVWSKQEPSTIEFLTSIIWKTACLVPHLIHVSAKLQLCSGQTLGWWPRHFMTYLVLSPNQVVLLGSIKTWISANGEGQVLFHSGQSWRRWGLKSWIEFVTAVRSFGAA